MTYIPFILSFSKGVWDFRSENGKDSIELSSVVATLLIGGQVRHLALIKSCRQQS